MITQDTKKMTLTEVWPQLKYAITWMLQNKIEGAMDLLNLIVCRRRKEIELETKQKSEQEETEIPKSEEAHDQQENEVQKNMLEIEVIENPKSDKESNRYVMVATLQQEGCSDQECESDEVISVKAFRQKREDKRGKEAPWNTSRDASRRAKEVLEKSKEQAQKEKPDIRVKAVRNSVAQAAWGSEVKRPLREEVEDPSASSYEDS